MPKLIREAAHAGTWYEGNGTVLSQQIHSLLNAAPSPTAPAGPGRALIGPHAGYKYCGHVLADAYKHIDCSNITRIFILGPSHWFHARRCLLSSAAVYRTPLGDLEIDQGVYAELKATGGFENMSSQVDEGDHALEMHLPFIVTAMGPRHYKIVPMLVGSLTLDSEAKYARILAPYLDDPANLFVISTDFCHWGSRFNYTFYDKAQGSIYKSIEWLDRLGMQLIEQGDSAGFSKYIKQYGNTICGRHAIAIFLKMLEHSSLTHRIEFKSYDQSSQCISMRDSSVSYASAVVTLQDKPAS